MASSVYSTQLLVVRGLNGSQAFICPSGFRCVLRDLDSYYNGLVDASIHLAGSSSQTIWYNGYSAGGNPQYSSWRGRQVIDEGQAFTVTTDQAIDVSVSGYLLTLP